MTIRAFQRWNISFRLHYARSARMLVFAGLMAVFYFGHCLCFEAQAQTGGKPEEQTTGAGAATSGPNFAPIGNTGYMVPIPEIKMNRIIGDKPAPPPTPAPQPEHSADTPTPPPTAKPPPEHSIDTPAPATDTPSAEVEAEPSPTGGRPTEPAEAPDRPHIERLPFEPVDRGHAIEQPLEPAPTKEPPPKEPPEKEESAPLLQPPVVPEDAMDAPVPKKELLGKKTEPVMPPLLQLEPVKRASKPMPLDWTKAQDEAGSKERIPLDPRGEPEVVPAVEPEAPAPQEPEKEDREEATREPLPSPEPMRSPLLVPPPEPEPEPEPTARESIPPASAPPPAVEEPVETEQSLPPVKQPAPRVKEVLPSPLAKEALDSFEVKEYLRETAPLLEELSLLMTRAPSLNIADYDPSDSDSPFVPKDIYLKMASMKRELQNLDSKTFAIIPPPRYVAFHSVIHESITETLQACDAIISYLNERNDENLQKILEHLTKARELIKKTRTIEG